MRYNTKKIYLTTGLALALTASTYAQAQNCLREACIKVTGPTLTTPQLLVVLSEHTRVQANPSVYQVHPFAQQKLGWAGGPMRGNDVLLSVDLGGQRDLFLANCDGVNPGKLERLTQTPDRNEESPHYQADGSINYHCNLPDGNTEFYSYRNGQTTLFTNIRKWEAEHPAPVPPPPAAKAPEPINRSVIGHVYDVTSVLIPPLGILRKIFDF